MKIKNPFKMNNWDIRSFLIVVLSVQLMYLGSVGLNKLDIQIPLLRQILGFIYLTFIPGYLLLRILKTHGLSSEESFLYAIGLSLFFSMFIGFLMNMLYPPLGITDKPISEVPVILTFTLITFLLSILAYFRDKNYNKPDFIDLKDILNPQVLFLSLIPFMAIFGTYLVNHYNDNILLMVMIVVIALVSLIVGFTNWLNEKYYPHAIWVIAIALIFHKTLVGKYIKIYDGEGFIPKTVIREGVIEFNKYHSNYFAVVGNTILVPIIIHITELSLIWVYKIIFPFFLSMIPVGLYYLFSQIKILKYKKEIFLASLLYIVHDSFFGLISFLKKQLLAMFFLVLFLLVLFNNNTNKVYKSILALVFSIGILWSHYGTGCLIMVMLLFTAGVLAWNNKWLGDKNRIINIAIIYSATFLGWYMFVTKSSVIASVARIGKTIIEVIYTEFFVPEASRGFVLLTKSPRSIWHMLHRILFLIIFSLICIGYLQSLLSTNVKKVKNTILLTCLIFSLYWFLIMGAALILPFFAVMNPSRLYSLAYILLIQFSIIGIKKLYNLLNLAIKNSFLKKVHFLRALFILSILYLTLSTGFVNELTKIDPKSVALSKKSILAYGDIERKGTYYSFIIQPYDVHGVRWLSAKRDQNRKIYATIGFLDTVGIFRPYGNIPRTDVYPIKQDSRYLYNNTYIFLYTLNIRENIGVDVDPYATHLIWYNITEIYIYNLLKNQNRIYDNEGCQVLWVS